MKQKFEEKNGVKPWQYILIFIAVVITGTLGLLDWLMLRETILLLLTVGSIDPWSWSAIDKFSFVLFGMAWLVFIYLSAHYYKKGTANRQMWSYFLLTVGIEIMILFVGHFLAILLGKEQYSIVLALLEMLAGIGCIILSLCARFRRVKFNGEKL
ncbi:MAG: hypothetical protein GX166_05105 [Clostridiaceae bacterium]|nr:hypothetical protein [Clostridiaceae bacterium]